MKQSVKAINEMVLAIEDRFAHYKFVDVVEKGRGYKLVRNGFSVGSVQIPVATIYQGYDATHQAKSKIVSAQQIRKEVLDRFSGMSYSPERDLVVPCETILRDVSRCIDNFNVDVSFRYSQVRYTDTIDVVISARDANCIAEVSFKGAAFMQL